MSNAVDYLELQAKLQPDRLALADLASGQRWSHGRLHHAAAQGVTHLLRLGVREGDRVASLAKNQVELAILHLACARLGAIYTPLNWRLAKPELQALLADAEPHLLVGDSAVSAAGLNGMALDEFAPAREACEPTFLPMADPLRPSLILYTSGTSGRPKGAVLSEANLAEIAINSTLLCRVTHESIFLVDAPMFHTIGLIANIRPALMRGGAALISDGFNPTRTLARLSATDLGVTHYFCVPQMASALRADASFDPNRLRKLTAIFTGGAPHPAPNIRAWLADGIPVSDGYGSSEAGTVFGMPVDAALIDRRAGSVGLATPRVRSRIVDSTGRTASPGEPGELQLRAASITRGYWRREEETRTAFTEDGWFRTGDIARADAEGYHWIVDRSRDLYISGGENIYPAEIEAALASLPGVAECAVIGVPDERWGEVGHLFLKVVPGAALGPDTILAALEQRIARFKLPKKVTLVEAIPRNAAGKIVKHVLRASLGSSTQPPQL